MVAQHDELVSPVLKTDSAKPNLHMTFASNTVYRLRACQACGSRTALGAERQHTCVSVFMILLDEHLEPTLETVRIAHA